MLALSSGDSLKAHSIILSLAFAVVMILNDWQDAENIRKDDGRWWLRIGLMLLAGVTGGALANKLWSCFVIGLVALCVDARLLIRRIEKTANTIPKS